LLPSSADQVLGIVCLHPSHNHRLLQYITTTYRWYYYHGWAKILQRHGAPKILVAVGLKNFGWLGDTTEFFQEQNFLACGGIQWLKVY